MLQLRKRLYPWVERAVLATGQLCLQDAVWNACRRLIFVCSGNICRSPYAEAVARGCGLAAISCGTHTDPDLPANRTAIEVAAARGVDLGSHRTTRWQDVALRGGDIAVAMQLKHALGVRARAERAGCGIVLLSSLLPKFSVLQDPYGRPREEFVQVFDLIDVSVAHIARRMGTRNGRLE